MLRRLIAALLMSIHAVGPAAAYSLSDGQYFFRYKSGLSVAGETSVSKDITAFYIAGVGEQFSEKLPMKADWQNDNWRIVRGSLPDGISFNPSTLTFEGEATGTATNIVADLKGFDANDQEVATATVSFNVYDLPDSVVSVDFYHHTNKYASDALTLPAGVTIDGDPVLISSAPPGVKFNARYFDGTPTKAGVYPVLAFGYDYTHSKPIIAFKGKYTVEDGPVFARVGDDLRKLGVSTYYGCGLGSECAVWLENSTPKILRPVKSAADVRYYAEVQGGGSLPGTLRFSDGPFELQKNGVTYTSYDQATVRYKAIDVDNTVGYSNWFKIGSLGHTELCQANGSDPFIEIRGTVDSVLNGTAGGYSIPDSKDSSVKQYAVTSGTLPPGITFDATRGAFVGTPTKLGTTEGVQVTISYPNSNGSVPVTCGPYKFSIAPTALSLVHSPLKAHYRVGETIDVTVSPNGKTIAPFTIALDANAALPAGVSFDASTGKLTGIITAKGKYGATFVLTNGDGLTYRTGLSFEGHDPVNVNDVANFSAIKRFETSDELFKVTYDADTLIDGEKWSLIGGALPAGITFNSGELTVSGGTCLPVNTYGPFKIQLTDGTGQSDRTNDFYIDVTEREPLTAGQTFNLNYSVNLSDPGKKPFSISRPKLAESCYPSIEYTLNPTILPDGLKFNPSNGLIFGLPTAKSTTPGYTLTINEISPYQYSETSKPFSIIINDPPPIKDTTLPALKGTVNVSRMSSADPKSTLRSIRDSLVGFEQAVIFDGVDTQIPGMTFDVARGVFSGVPTVEFNGTVAISYHDGANRPGRLLVPVTVYPYPGLKAENTVYELPRLADALGYEIKVTPSNNGFYNGVTYSLAPSSDPLPAGITLRNNTLALSTKAPKGTSYNIVIRGTSKADASVFAEQSFTLKIIEQQPMKLDVKPDSKLIWTVDEATGNVVTRQNFTSVTPSGSYVGPVAYSLLNSPSWMTISADGMLGGTPPSLGERAATVQVADSEQSTATDSATVKVTLSGYVKLAPGSHDPLKVRVSESIKTTNQVVSNVVPPYALEVSGNKPASVTFDTSTGIFSGQINTTGSYKWFLNVEDADNRKAEQSYTYEVVTVPRVKISGAKSVVNGKQYDAALPISLKFEPAENIMGQATYVVTGNIPGSVAYKYYANNDPSQLATYYLENGTVVRQNPGETAAEAERDRLPLDHMIFDTLALTLKGIPSEAGSFEIGIAVADSYETTGYSVNPNDATRSDYNNAASSMVTVTVEPAADLQVANSMDSEALHQFTSLPSMTVSVSNDAYGRGIQKWTKLSGTLPKKVYDIQSTDGLSYIGYPDTQGTWNDIRWQATDVAGRVASTNPASFTVGPRQPLELVASASIPRGMLVFDGDANLSITAKNRANGVAIGTGNWTVAGTVNLPPGVTFDITDSEVKFSGTSGVIGTYSGITVSAVDTLGARASINITFKVISSSDPIELNVSEIRTKVGYPIEMTPPFAATMLSTANTYGTVRFSSDDLPNIGGISLDQTTGYIKGTVSTAQNLNFDLKVTDDTNRVTRKPVVVSVIPKLRLIMPSQVQAEQGKVTSTNVATDYALGNVTYEKGAGDWPVGFVVNPATGVITTNYTNPVTGKSGNTVVAASGVYPGLTVVGKDTFGAYIDQQSSNTFSIVVAPTTATPDIANQTKSILGTEGTTIVNWAPNGTAGWAAGVVEKGKIATAWNYAGTIYKASHDLSQYGLTFDTASGIISGTPTAPFIIRDFVITVTSQRGDSDSTTPFWIGVAPKAAMAVDANQKTAYVHRNGSPISTDPITVINTLGDLNFSKPGNATLDWDVNTGVMSYASSIWSSGTPTYTTRITDEFNRSITFSWSAAFRAALVAKASAATVNLDKVYTSAAPVLQSTVTGLAGVDTWTVSGLPSGLTFDPSSKSIVGTAQSGTVSVGIYPVTFTVKDSSDGQEATVVVNLTVVSASPDIADQAKTILGTEDTAIASWSPKAASGWAGGVVEQGKTTVAWNYPGTVFSANYDLGQYGLTLDTATGAISGTPNTPFIIRDFVITVTGPSGATDSTTPFWIGVRPKAALALDNSKTRTSYNFRTEEIERTDPVVLMPQTTVGTWTAVKMQTTVHPLDPQTGAFTFDLITYNVPGSHVRTIRITDEFNRTLDINISLVIRLALQVSPTTASASSGVAYTTAKPVLKPTVANAFGSVTWSATGLPEGLSIDPTSGAVHGSISAEAAPGDYNVTYSVTDRGDGKSASASGVITVLKPYKYWRMTATAVKVNAGGDYMCLSELRWLQNGVDVSLDGSLTADSLFPGKSISLLVDGLYGASADFASVFCTNGSNGTPEFGQPHWIQLNLNNPKVIDSLAIYARRDGSSTTHPTAWTITKSEDGVNWVPGWTGANSGMGNGSVFTTKP